MTGLRDRFRVVVLSLVLLGALFGIAPGVVDTVAATDTAPTCSTVSYTQNASGFHEITNVSQLQCIADNGLDQDYVLTNDIDASGTAQWNKSAGFEPIAKDTETEINYQGTPFTGTFDGNGYTISELYIEQPAENYVGLFGRIGSSGTLTSIGLENATVRGSSYVGGLLGFNDRGTVQSSYATGSIDGDNYWVGGLVGYNRYGTVQSSYTTGSVDGDSDVGGLVGQNNRGTVKSSYATGSVADSSDVGGLVGENDDGTVEDSYWDRGTTNQSTGIGTGSGTNLTGFGTINDTQPATEMTGLDAPENMQRFVFYDDSPWVPTESYPALAVFSEGPTDRASVVDSLLEGSGTAANPYTITTPGELQAINADLTASYTLGNDINASGTAQWNGGDGFEPIGNSSHTFGGSFNGATHTIAGLSINRSGSYIGLFGFVDSGGAVTNVGVENATIAGGGAVGGLAGRNDGTVNTSYVTGVVSGTGDYIGGLIGYNFGAGGSVNRSSAGGSVIGNGRYTGGLVGRNQGGTVSQSYATGAVDGESRVGGLVGTLGINSQTNESFATGSVNGSEFVGGLVGQSSGSLRDGYATGVVSGDTAVGGLVGDKFTGSVEDSYWDRGTTNQSTAIGSGSGTDLTGFGTVNDTAPATEMTGLDAPENMQRFAFYDESTWVPTESYPALAVLSGGPTDRASVVDSLLEGSGTVANPYTITTPGELQAMNADLTANYMLGNDINASVTSTWNEGAGFEPLAKDTNNSKDAYQGTGFAGSFDGAGHTVSGLYINRPSTDYVGLFSNTERTADIDNIGLEDVDIRGDESVTGLSSLQYGSVNQSFVTGNISGNYFVSGLASTNGGTVSQSYSTSNVTGISSVAGLIDVNTGTVSQSHAVSTVSGNQSAGLIRVNRRNVSQSYARGDVSSDDSAGGLIRTNSGRVNRSYATGNVSADRNVGGLVGRNGGQIHQSYATGTVSGTDNIGGLVGYSLMGMINQSYATATVSGHDYVGGLVGYTSQGAVNRSYATGTVSGTTNLGGVVGDGFNYSIEGSYWDVGTTGQANAAGAPTGTTSTLTGFGDVTDTGPAAEMQRFAPTVTMTAFDFESTWTLTSGYPRLAWDTPTPITVDSLAASNQTVTAGNSGTITVTANESGVDAGEGVTLEVVDNDGLGGLPIGETAVTDANGTATFNVSENTAGSYGVTLAWVDDSTVNTTLTVTVTAPPSDDNSGGGGGGGGGGRSADTAEVAVSTESAADETTVSTITVDGAVAGQPTTIAREDGEPLAKGDDTSVDSLSVTTNTDRDFSVSVRSSEALDENNPEGAIALSRETDGADPIEYLTIDHDLADEEIDEARITFSVTEDDLEGPRSEVTLFRNVDGAWQPLETTLVGENGNTAQYEAITPGFSIFAIGGNEPPDNEQETDSPTTPSTAEPQTDDETPGFSILLGLISVLAVALMARRQR